MNSPRKPQRRTRAELRQLMIDAGKEVLRDLKPTMGFEALTYASVFEHLLSEHGEKVTRGSVHERIWQSQLEYRLDVLADMIADTPQVTFGVFEPGALGAIESADLTTVPGRKHAAQDLVRALFNQSAGAIFSGFGSREAEVAFIVRNRLWETKDHVTQDTKAVAALLLDHRKNTTALYVEMIHGLMDLLGLRPRPQFQNAAELIAVLSNALAVGVVTDPLPLPHTTFDLPTGPTGELEPWHPTSMAVWAIIRDVLEIDDDSLTEPERRL